jgi:hypothetical protein
MIHQRKNKNYLKRDRSEIKHQLRKTLKISQMNPQKRLEKLYLMKMKIEVLEMILRMRKKMMMNLLVKFLQIVNQPQQLQFRMFKEVPEEEDLQEEWVLS